MNWLISSIEPLSYSGYVLDAFFYWKTISLQLLFRWFLVFHNRLIAIIIWLISSVAALFIGIMIGLISSIAPQFFCNFQLADFFYSTTVLSLLWVGWLPLLHTCVIAIMIWLVYSVPRLFSYNYNFADFFLFHHHFIAIIIWLISSMAPLSYYNYHLADFSYCTTVLLEL